MKKIGLWCVSVLMLCSSVVAGLSTSEEDARSMTSPPMERIGVSFTHTVFVEEGTTTWCPNCPMAAEALYSLYGNNSGFPFYYVALVVDKSSVARDRFSWHYRGRAIPTVFFDGGFSQLVGTPSTLQLTEAKYRTMIQEAGNRTVHPLGLTTSATGQGNAQLAITVQVKNTGDKPYVGIVRTYVTEKVSRWEDQKGHPYHFGFLDYAIKKIVFLPPGKEKTFSVTWDGAAKHGNLTFPDIVDENILVITTAAHWRPHMIPKEDYVNTHLAFYVDQTVATEVNAE